MWLTRIMNVGRPLQAADPLSGASSRLKAGRGQASLEFALLYAGVILPLTFMIVFVAEMLWVWHSVTDFTRDGATRTPHHRI